MIRTHRHRDDKWGALRHGAAALVVLLALVGHDALAQGASEGSAAPRADSAPAPTAAPGATTSESAAPDDGPAPVAIPEPRRLDLTARRVERGEIAISDPIPHAVSPLRTEPVRPDVPEGHALAVGGTRQAPDTVEIPEPLTAETVTLRRSPPPPPAIVGLDDAAITASRTAPGEPGLREPFEVSIGAAREVLDVSEARDVIASCDFNAIREQLRFLVARSDQLDADGRRVIAELSRINRANTAYEAARARYNAGQLEDLPTLLEAARGTPCPAREAAIGAALEKSRRLDTVLQRLDEAVDACNIPALSAMQRQLSGVTHPALLRRKATLDALSAPAAEADRASTAADTAVAAGRLDEAQQRLADALAALESIPEQVQCNQLRERVAAQQTEIERLAGLAAEAERVYGACDIAAMTALSNRLAGEDNALLVARKQAIDEVNVPASAARTFRASAESLLARTRLDAARTAIAEAEAQLARIPDEALCPAMRADVAATRTELTRVSALAGAADRAEEAMQAGRLNEARQLLGEARTGIEGSAAGRYAALRDRIDQLGTDVSRVSGLAAEADAVIAACDIADMTTLSNRLAGEDNVLLEQKKRAIDDVVVPASAARTYGGGAEALLADSRLDEAGAALDEAETQLARIADAALCPAVRADIAATKTELVRVRGLVARADAAEQALQAGRIEDARTALDAARAGLDETADTGRYAAIRERVAGQQEAIARVEALAARADAVVAACDIEAMTALSNRLTGEDNVLLQRKKSEIDRINVPASAARSFRAGAASLLERGQLDEADGMLDDAAARVESIANQALCPTLSGDIAATRDEVARIRGLVAGADRAIAACDAPALESLGRELAESDHVLLERRRATISSIRARAAEIDESLRAAAESYAAGRLDEADAAVADADATLQTLSGKTMCTPLREATGERRQSIAELRRQLAEADGAVAACNAPRLLEVATSFDNSEHLLLIARREELRRLAAPLGEATELNRGAKPLYLEGKLDEAESALRTASAKLETVPSCAALRDQIKNRLAKIVRMRDVLGRVDGAVAACSIPAMTLMSRQLEGQSHVLLTRRLERVTAVNRPATAAESLRRAGAAAFDGGDLATARQRYRAAGERLAGVDTALCTGMRQAIATRLEEIGEITATLETADKAVASCSLPDLRTMSAKLEGRDYVLLARRKQAIDAIIQPLATATESRDQALPLYEDGELDRAETLLDRAGTALARIDDGLCAPLREDVAGAKQRIGTVRDLLAQGDAALQNCAVERLDDLSKRMQAVPHRLLASKEAELSTFFAPVQSVVALGDRARTLYFDGNLNGAETRLGEAREEIGKRPACSDIAARIDRREDRIDRLRVVLARVDQAVEACHIPAMTSMSEQLAGNDHKLLVQKKAKLDDVNDPASAARNLAQEAEPLFQNGQLVAAETRLRQALDRLDQIDSSLCLPLRRRVDQQLEETDRIRSTLVLVDAAIQSCNHADIDLLAANLANASHVSLERALDDLRAGRLRCGLSDTEKRLQAEETCQRKHPNSVVDEFDAATGRYTCVCPQGYLWDPESASCIALQVVQAAADRICQGGYANSRAVNLRAPTEFECNCQESYVWNQDETACIPAKVVVDEAVAACARDGGYPVEIESAGRYTCCPTGTVWNKPRRECVPESEAASGTSGADPQCRWIRTPSGTSDTSFVCTCEPNELCGPRPDLGSGPAATTVEPATPEAAPSGPAPSGPAPSGTTPAPAADPTPAAEGAGQGEAGGFFGRVKNLFGIE